MTKEGNRMNVEMTDEEADGRLQEAFFAVEGGGTRKNRPLRIKARAIWAKWNQHRHQKLCVNPLRQ